MWPRERVFWLSNGNRTTAVRRGVWMRPGALVWLVLVAAAIAWGCGGNGTPTPGSPTPVPSRLHFRAGPQILDVTGFGLSSDPLYPPCSPLGAPRAGTSVSTRIMLEQSGSDWIASSTSSSSGTLRLRLIDTGSSSVVGDLVSGTIQGSGIDMGEESRPPKGVTATFTGAGGAAILDGTVQRTAFLTTGRITGGIDFTDGTSTGVCSAVQWLMSPVSGIFGLVGLGLPQATW